MVGLRSMVPMMSGGPGVDALKRRLLGRFFCFETELGLGSGWLIRGALRADGGAVTLDACDVRGAPSRSRAPVGASLCRSAKYADSPALLATRGKSANSPLGTGTQTVRTWRASAPTPLRCAARWHRGAPPAARLRLGGPGWAGSMVLNAYFRSQPLPTSETEHHCFRSISAQCRLGASSIAWVDVAGAAVEEAMDLASVRVPSPEGAVGCEEKEEVAEAAEA